MINLYTGVSKKSLREALLCYIKSVVTGRKWNLSEVRDHYKET